MYGPILAIISVVEQRRSRAASRPERDNAIRRRCCDPGREPLLFQSFHVVTRPLDRSTDYLHIGHLLVKGDPDTMVVGIGVELLDPR